MIIEMEYVPGYDNLLKSRSSGRGGGVGLLVNKEIFPTHAVKHFPTNEAEMESLFIQTNHNSKNEIIGVVYRPPNGDLAKFNIAFDKLLKMLDEEKKPCYILGDFNINLLNTDTHLETQNFLNILLAYGFYPLIDKPTRMTQRSTSLIDNILTNVHPNEIETCSIWITDISDHLPVCCSVCPFQTKQTQDRRFTNRQLTTRKVSKESELKFKNELQSFEWNSILTSTEVNTNFNNFLEQFKKLYNSSFPLVKLRNKRKSANLPWITSALRKSIGKKNRLYKKYLKTRGSNNENFVKYKTYRNKLTELLRAAEKNYYAERLEYHRSNLHKTWQTINTVLGRKSKRNSIVEILHNNNCINDSKSMADIFNNYFNKIGPQLASNIPPSTITHKEYLTPRSGRSFFFNPVTPLEVMDIIALLKNSHSKGYDEISTDTLKLCPYEVHTILAEIFNQSLEQGIFPQHLKIGKITPIFKAGDKQKVSNYRPISVLSPFAKVLEKIVQNRVTHFIEQEKILSDSQFGFRKNLSAELAIHELTDKISRAIDDHKITVGIFLDLSKAFDTVNHTILLDKLEHYGIRGTPLTWFKSYLTNRVQYVSIDNESSAHLLVRCGVPQGSILGPLLFILYINDLQAVTDLDLIMFADDTNIFATGLTKNVLVGKLNLDLNLISDWFAANLLSLNLDKTCYMIFGNKQNLNIDLDIRINNEKLIRTYETKFLGVIITPDLKWERHVDMIVNKMSKVVGIFRKIRYKLNLVVLKQLYHTLLEPYITYCSSIWSSPHKTVNLNRVLLLQKAAVRIISQSHYIAHTDPIFSSLKILKVYDIAKTALLVLMHKSRNNTLPHKFQTYFQLTSQIHSYYTRGAEKYAIPYARTRCRLNSLQVIGPRFWNSLPPALQEIKTLQRFKSKLKEFFILDYGKD